MQSSKPIRHPRTSPELAAALAALATLALIYFAWPVYRAFLPLQIDINKAWSAYQTCFAPGNRSIRPTTSSPTTIRRCHFMS
jgi:hypothetical protein